MVSYFIRALAYLFRNVAMALGDPEPLCVWDYASLYDGCSEMVVCENGIADPTNVMCDRNCGSFTVAD